jgi:hypothetical protein
LAGPEPVYIEEPPPAFVAERSETAEAPKRVEDAAKPAVSIGDDGLLSYGTKFLPEDILKKWIGQS